MRNVRDVPGHGCDGAYSGMRKRWRQNAAQRRSGAFSLMELIIVIIILGLLASMVMPNIMGKGEEAKQKLVCIQMKNISETLKMFKVDNGTYPSTEEGLGALLSNPDAERYPNYAASGYFEGSALPRDSWQSDFIYVMSEEGFDLISLGSDRKEGGSGEGADIRYSECGR